MRQLQEVEASRESSDRDPAITIPAKSRTRSGTAELQSGYTMWRDWRSMSAGGGVRGGAREQDGEKGEWW